MGKSASKIVSSAILGYDSENVIINGKIYNIKPPTIKKIAGAGYYLSDIAETGLELSDILKSIKDIGKVANAVSWFIAGNESLSEELKDGTLQELVEALGVALSLISAENFIKLLGLARNVAILTANQK